MKFSAQTLAVFQQLLAFNKVGVYDNGSRTSFEQLMQARVELDQAIADAQRPAQTPPPPAV